MKELTEEIYKETISKQNKLVIVDYAASWCGPCQILGPKLKEIAKEFPSAIEIYKVDVDDNPNLVIGDHIKDIPTMVFFIGGKEVYRIAGAKPTSFIENAIKEQYQDAISKSLIK